MSRAKKGDILYCEVCGLTAIVEEECGCANVGVICCEEPMINKGPAPPKKKTAKKKTVKKTAKKPAKKSAAKKKPAKKKKR